MTVIAWDGRTLAADRQATNCSMKFAVTKLTRFKDGSVAAATGSAAAGNIMRQWYEDGADLTKYPECQKGDDWARLIVAKPDGIVWYYENLPAAIKSEQTPAAWGSGRDFAIGAMLAGADAARAVEITNMVSTDCGLGVDSASPAAPGPIIYPGRCKTHAQPERLGPWLNGAGLAEPGQRPCSDPRWRGC